VVQAFNCDAEAAFAEKPDDFVSVCDVVFQGNSVVALAVVKPEIGVVVRLVGTWLLLVHHRLNLLDILAKVVDLRVV
jgi:hypothetical protein